MKKVIVYGMNILSKMLYNDALGDDGFEIACFAVDTGHMGGRTQMLGLPLVDMDVVQQLYPPDEYDMVALFDGYDCMRDREKKYMRAKDKGYRLRNYISKKADVPENIPMGDNNIIMGQTHIGIEGRMGKNNLIRQNVYLGHGFKLGDNNVITAGCSIGGDCELKNNCYIGLGSTIVNNTIIEEETLVGAGCVLIRNTEPYSKNVGNPGRIIGYHKEEGMMMSVHE